MVSKFSIIIVFILLLVGCDRIDETYTTEDSIFLAGQSNASPELAHVLEVTTGLGVSNSCNGGQPIQNWFNEHDNLSKDYPHSQKEYFIWFHGESNAGNYDGYEDLLKKIIEVLAPNSKIIIIQVYFEDYDASNFRSYQEEMCNNNGWTLIDSSDCSRHDGLHLDQEGMIKLSNKIRSYINEY